VLINGIRVLLSDPGSAINQSGHISVAANNTFGWYINCTDCIEGAATATITNFVAGLAVPEPGTMALIGFGVAAVAFTRRQRRVPAGLIAA
jgi:hypothetical protein